MKNKHLYKDWDPVPSENTNEHWNYDRIIIIRLVAWIIIGLIIAAGIVTAGVMLASFCFQHQTWSILTFVSLVFCFGIWRMVKRLRKWKSYTYNEVTTTWCRTKSKWSWYRYTLRRIQFTWWPIKYWYRNAYVGEHRLLSMFSSRPTMKLCQWLKYRLLEMRVYFQRTPLCKPNKTRGS